MIRWYNRLRFRATFTVPPMLLVETEPEDRMPVSMIVTVNLSTDKNGNKKIRGSYVSEYAAIRAAAGTDSLEERERFRFRPVHRSEYRFTDS